MVDQIFEKVQDSESLILESQVLEFETLDVITDLDDYLLEKPDLLLENSMKVRRKKGL